MKRWIWLFVMIAFFGTAVVGCNTNKPADEVKGAQDRVKQKVEEERQNQTAENPGE